MFSFWIIFRFIVYVSILLLVLHYLDFTAALLFFKVVSVIQGIFISILILESAVDFYKKVC